MLTLEKIPANNELHCLILCSYIYNNLCIVGSHMCDQGIIKFPTKQEKTTLRECSLGKESLMRMKTKPKFSGFW